jgi:2-C-methyl-D-erythritol 4-phosphate cytidylyltransferase
VTRAQVSYWLVVPAAGAGRRFGAAKQHASVAGATVLQWALRPFAAPHCRGGIIALAPDDPERLRFAAGLPSQFRIVDGGVQRADSVLRGLAALVAQGAQPHDWVLVHDAARPCLSADDLDRLLAQAAGVDGGLLAAPVTDTVKQAQVAAPTLAAAPALADRALAAEIAVNRVGTTLPRETLWLAQTPQMFHLGPLTAALTAALDVGRVPTDEAQAMEWQGVQPVLVETRDGNPKITTAADLLLAEALLKSRQRTKRAEEAQGGS